MRAKDKVALVTGGAAGWGTAIARRLVSEGANVIVTDIQTHRGQALANELGCEFIQHDVTDEKQWEGVIAEVESLHGGLHIVVNGARAEDPVDSASLERTRLSDWQAAHRVNVEGVFLGCRAALPALRRSGGGSIVNLSSAAALGPTPEFVAYGASQAAVLHLTRSVALYCDQNGSRIRCNSVHRGALTPPVVERIVADKPRERGLSTERMSADLGSRLPEEALQTPDHIAGAVLFLVSDEAKHVTGQALVVDGGRFRAFSSAMADMLILRKFFP